MKKLICVILSLTLLFLTACAAPGNLIPPNTDSGNIGGQNAPAAQKDATIEQTTLLDESGIKIVATGISHDSFFGPELNLLIENNTTTDLTFQCRNVSVNGYMVDTIMSVDVAAGKKANDAITFASSDLEACGIEVFADMEFSFHIFSTEDWDTILDTDPIRLKTSITDTYQYNYDHEGTPVYEGNGIKIIAKGLAADDSLFGPSVIVYIYNGSEKNITVQTRETSANGFMVDTVFSEDVTAGKHAVAAITFMDSDLEASGITQITNTEFSFHIFDAETWDTIVDTEAITLSFG